MRKLKPFEYKLLFELIRNSKQSDRQLAKILGVSQATVSRTRAKLEREKLLKYTAIPNLEKLGFEIVAFTFGGMKGEPSPEITEDKVLERMRREYLPKQPNVIFTSAGRGLGMTGVVISVHTDYTDYLEFEREFRRTWGKYIERIETFIISTKVKHGRDLSFEYLADYFKRIGEI